MISRRLVYSFTEHSCACAIGRVVKRRIQYRTKKRQQKNSVSKCFICVLIKVLYYSNFCEGPKCHACDNKAPVYFSFFFPLFASYLCIQLRLSTLAEPWRHLGGTLEAPWRHLGGTLEEPWMHLGGTLEEHWRNLGITRC